MYVQEDDFQGQAATHIRDAIEQTNPGSVEASLISARDCYKKGKNDFGMYCPVLFQRSTQEKSFIYSLLNVIDLLALFLHMEFVNFLY